MCYLKYDDRLVDRKTIVLMIEITNLILLLSLISLWVQAWVICIFYANNFTGFSLGRHLSPKFSLRENNSVSGNGLDVLWCNCIVMHHTHFCEGILECLFYIDFYIFYCSFLGFSKLYIDFNVFLFLLFIEILVQALLLSLQERKTLNFDQETGLFLL